VYPNQGQGMVIGYLDADRHRFSLLGFSTGMSTQQSAGFLWLE